VHYSGNLHQSDTILVHAACGGVGLAIIQMAAQRDCRILAMAGSDDKLKYLRSIGIHDVFNYRKGDYVPWVEQTIGAKKLGSSFNSVAGSTFKKDFKLLGPGGRLILFGAAERSDSSGPFAIPSLLWKMGILLPIQFMVNSVGITGVNMLKIGDHKPEILQACLQGVFELYDQKKIDPVVDSIFDVQQIALAHDRLESRLSIGKVGVRW
jgi:NADPH2:quinone reductase